MSNQHLPGGDPPDAPEQLDDNLPEPDEPDESGEPGEPGERGQPGEPGEPEGSIRPAARPEQPFRLPPEMRRSINAALEALGRSPGLQRLTAQMRESFGETFRSASQLDSIIGQFRRDFVLPLTESPQWREAVQGMARIGETLERYYPVNWTQAEVSYGDLDRVFAVAREDGIPLVRVPRGTLVDHLLQAPDSAARRQLLREHADDVVADCAAVAEAVTHHRLREHRARLLEAVAAFRADVPSAGQSLAAVVITALLQWVYGHEHLKNVRTSPMRAQDSERQVLRTVKLAVLIEAAVPAVQGNRDRVADEDLPDRFNRHVTVHRVADRVFVLPNALTALMLAAGLLAEAEQLLEDGLLQLQ